VKTYTLKDIAKLSMRQYKHLFKTSSLFRQQIKALCQPHISRAQFELDVQDSVHEARCTDRLLQERRGRGMAFDQTMPHDFPNYSFSYLRKAI